MDRRRLLLAGCCAIALAAVPAGAHEGVPRAWWLGEATAARKLQEQIGTPWVSGRCSGMAPRATRSGTAVYKHFTCIGRRRGPGGITFGFAYRVHVVGPRGRIAVG
jgi:hypothetical protein